MVVVVLGLEVLMNHIRIYEDDMLGYYVGFCDVITYGGKHVCSFSGNIMKKRMHAEMVEPGYGQ